MRSVVVIVETNPALGSGDPGAGADTVVVWPFVVTAALAVDDPKNSLATGLKVALNSRGWPGNVTVVSGSGKLATPLLLVNGSGVTSGVWVGSSSHVNRICFE